MPSSCQGGQMTTYRVSINMDLTVADEDALLAAGPDLMRRFLAEQGGKPIESNFVDNEDQAAAYAGMDPKTAFDLALFRGVVDALAAGPLAGSTYGTLAIESQHVD